MMYKNTSLDDSLFDLNICRNSPISGFEWQYIHRRKCQQVSWQLSQTDTRQFSNIMFSVPGGPDSQIKSLCERNGIEQQRIQVAAFVEAVVEFGSGNPRNTTWTPIYGVVIIWKAASCLLHTASPG